MGVFKIKADQLAWIGGAADDPQDRCLHGHVTVQFGDIVLEDHGTVSATALYLLKTLTEDKVMSYNDIQMIPCCGHFLIANADLTEVQISGCDTGTDWSTIHEGDHIRFVLPSGHEELVTLRDYRYEVLDFAKSVNLLDIVMQATTTLPKSPVTIGVADYYFGFDYVLSGGELVSVCNELEYRAYQYESGNTVELSAYTIINDVYFAFAMDVPQDDLEQAKADFQYVLECFAYYEEDKPDLSVVVPEEIPELMEQVFNTLAEAQAEPDFGRYLPSEIPAGFGDSTIYRFRFQDSNFLTAMWSRGMDDLSWVVTPYTEEDAHRLTGVNDKKNYDLSLYPIPRADSVPDELRDIVNDPIFDAKELTLDAVYCRAYKIDDAGDTDGWRMKFSVKYGDVIVAVSTKGVDPEWVYQQLENLISE